MARFSVQAFEVWLVICMGFTFCKFCVLFYPQLYSYCIAQNFDRGNFDVFDAFQLDRQNLTHQIVYKQCIVYRCIVNDSDHPSKYFCQIFEELVSVKNSPCQNFALYGKRFE